jgi:hypothetical protein
MNIIEPYRGYAAGNSGPGWPVDRPSGPELELGIDPTAADPRPQYNPAALLQDVADLLDRAGVQTDLTDRHYVATMKAADLLTAMGVKPSSAPTQARR